MPSNSPELTVSSQSSFMNKTENLQRDKISCLPIILRVYSALKGEGGLWRLDYGFSGEWGI